MTLGHYAQVGKLMIQNGVHEITHERSAPTSRTRRLPTSIFGCICTLGPKKKRQSKSWPIPYHEMTKSYENKQISRRSYTWRARRRVGTSHKRLPTLKAKVCGLGLSLIVSARMTQFQACLKVPAICCMIEWLCGCTRVGSKELYLEQRSTNSSIYGLVAEASRQNLLACTPRGKALRGSGPEPGKTCLQSNW